MKGKKIGLIVVGAVMLVAGIVAGIFLIKNNQDIRERAAPATSLSLKPSTQTKDKSQDFTIQVVADTGANKVTGLDIDITFDPKAFSVTTITKGADIANFSQEIRNTIDNTTGKISYSAFTLDSTKAVTGANIIALNITGKVKDTALAQTYKFSFAQTTAVSGSGEGQNVLTLASPANITVKAGASGSTSSPTPQPTGSGGNKTPSPTPQKTATPTSQSTSTPIATNSPTPTQTPAPTIAPTAAPTAAPTSLPIPETGVKETTFAILGVGVLAIFISVFAFAF